MRGRSARMASLGFMIGTALGAGCNQAPEIEQVGEYLIADSISDYLNPNVTDFPYFEAFAGQTLTFTVVAVDPDEDPIYFSAGPLPVGATFDPVTGVFTWTPAEEDYGGGLELYVVVQDDSGAWDSVIVYLAQSYGYYPYPEPYPGEEPPR